jgi:tetratricopeptide (TPR) repeat protein
LTARATSNRQAMSVQFRYTLVLIGLGATLVGPAWAQDQPDPEPQLPEIFKEAIPLYTSALGPFHRPISSTNETAQAYFDQGFQMMYAFAKIEAVRSFRESWKADPDCAICYWGEAWAWGSYLNGPIREDDAPHAYAAIQHAIRLAPSHATEKERAFIAAMSVRYVEAYDPDNRVEQDRAYADAMRVVAEQYSDDLDAVGLYGEALFLLEPRRGTRDLNDPNVQRLHSVLESVLAQDIRHPGACHLYIHATESTAEPGKAAACAEYLGTSIPGASHINHMPSHTWNEVGRWNDGVRANLMAWHSDQKAEIGEGFDIYPTHNLHMLLFAASMDGQGAIAIQAGKDYAKLTGDSVFHVLTLLRFGRFDEVLALAAHAEPRSNDVSAGILDFARGYAHLRNGDADFARVYLDRVLETAQTSEDRLRFHDAKHLLGVVGGILEGEIHREAGEVSAAIASFERAVELEDELMYDEPEPLPFAARHWLGASLIEAKRYHDAERTYREELEDHPHNGWSLFGLKLALSAQGKSMKTVDKDFEESWARADHWIRASRF